MTDQSESQELNYPFYEVAEKAQQIIDTGAKVFFKFTCVNCGSRQTFENPNTLYQYGKCEECEHVTNLVEKGCNFLILFGRINENSGEV